MNTKKGENIHACFLFGDMMRSIWEPMNMIRKHDYGIDDNVWWLLSLYVKRCRLRTVSIYFCSHEHFFADWRNVAVLFFCFNSPSSPRPDCLRVDFMCWKHKQSQTDGRNLFSKCIDFSYGIRMRFSTFDRPSCFAKLALHWFYKTSTFWIPHRILPPGIICYYF